MYRNVLSILQYRNILSSIGIYFQQPSHHSPTVSHKCSHKTQTPDRQKFQVYRRQKHVSQSSTSQVQQKNNLRSSTASSQAQGKSTAQLGQSCTVTRQQNSRSKTFREGTATNTNLEILKLS